MEIAKVLIDNSADLILDYKIPRNLVIKIGSRVSIPLKNKNVEGTVIEISKSSPFLKKLKNLSESKNSVKIDKNLILLAKWISKYYVTSLEKVISAIFPKYIKKEITHKRIPKFISLIKTPSSKEEASIEKKAKKQFFILQRLKKEKEKIKITELGKGNFYPAIKSLQKKGFIEIIEETQKTKKTFLKNHPFNLNQNQQKALNKIISSIRNKEKKPILLHGVTGSGKTEIYLQACENILKNQKTAIVLVPEISLTSQIIELFKSRFSEIQDKVYIFHSSLSQEERRNTWNAINENKVKILIGSRSAIFTPMQKLGLIIVDEEHDQSYKQDSSPRYHGRDVAIMRAHIENISIVLGSATPSLESFYNCSKKKYQKIELKNRIYNYSMPLIRVIDMRMQYKQSFGEISQILIEKIKDRIQKKEQTILFINRRGYYSISECKKCGTIKECLHCSIPLVYHYKEECFKCHICEYSEKKQKSTCFSCGKSEISQKKQGTQKIEEDIQKILPKSKVLRIDGDIKLIQEKLDKFQKKQADILVGTQIISKGLHFPNVTLVGVLNADISLNYPEDFRSNEKTFQLLTQVSGRSGRSEKNGEVIIQTFIPHAPAIQFAKNQNYQGYFEQEINFRKKLSYPPFTHLAIIKISSNQKKVAEITAKNFHQKINKKLLLTHPISAFLEKSHDEYHYQFTARHPKGTYLSQILYECLKKNPISKKVKIKIDIDGMFFS